MMRKYNAKPQGFATFFIRRNVRTTNYESSNNPVNTITSQMECFTSMYI